MQNVMDKLGHVGLCYYIIMELCAEKLDKNKNESLEEVGHLFSFSGRILRQSCRLSQTNVRLLLDICQTNCLLEWKEVENEFEISMPILLNLLDRDHKKARKVRAKSAQSTRPEENRIEENRIEENRIEKIVISPAKTAELPAAIKINSSLVKIESPKQLADLLDDKNKNILFELYGEPDFIKREFYKIQNWLDANPRKNKKSKRGWLVFVSSWLEKGWPEYQKNITSNKSKASSVAELMSMMGWDKENGS